MSLCQITYITIVKINFFVLSVFNITEQNSYDRY